MGWLSLGPKELHAFTGDAPIDAMAKATRQIADLYAARFGRPPMLAEVLHALRTVLAADEELLFDSERLATDFPSPALAAPAPRPLDAYEGSTSEEPAPRGTHHIAERATGRDVVTCRWRLEDRVLLVDYTILDPSVEEAQARRMITYVLLHKLAGDYYRTQADEISFARTDVADRRTVVKYGD